MNAATQGNTPVKTAAKHAVIAAANGGSGLQTALPAAIKQASSGNNSLVTKPTEVINLRRRIYNAFVEVGEQISHQEMHDGLVKEGYSGVSIENELKAMRGFGWIARTQKKPYAYSMNASFPVPTEEMVQLRRSYRRVQAATPTPKPQASGSTQQQQNLHTTLGALASNLNSGGGIHYGALASDLDLLITYLSKMKANCADISRMANAAEGMDPEIAREYEPISTDIDTILVHLHKMKTSITQIAQFAKSIRSAPLQA